MTVHSTDLPFFGGSFDVSMGSQLAWGVGFCVFWAVVIELWLKLNVPRGYVWATEAYSALKFFHDAGDDAFFYGALPLSLLMTLFNVVLIVDVTQSFVKYVILGQRDGGVAKAADASVH